MLPPQPGTPQPKALVLALGKENQQESVMTEASQRMEDRQQALQGLTTGIRREDNNKQGMGAWMEEVK